MYFTPRINSVSSVVYAVLSLGILLFFLTVVPKTSEAQMSIQTNSPQLLLQPKLPEPNSEVNVSLDAYTMNTAGAKISWFIDGVEIAERANARSITVTTGELGEEMTVSAQVQQGGGGGFTVRSNIVPGAVDLVLEAETYVPPFYRGRALPSADATVRVVAVPHIAGTTDPRTLTYLWEYNGGVLLGGPVRGEQSVELEASRFSGGYIRVVVSNSDGENVAENAIFIEAMNPEIHFYEENPLRGLSELAIKDSLSLIGEETTIHGEPYFFGSDLFRDKTTFDWKIDGAAVTSANADPHTITLRRAGGGGSARIQVRALGATPIPQFVDGSFRINF
jgi:hypothetical protein